MQLHTGSFPHLKQTFGAKSVPRSISSTAVCISVMKCFRPDDETTFLSDGKRLYYLAILFIPGKALIVPPL